MGAGSFHFHWPACWEQELSIHLQVVPTSAWCHPHAHPSFSPHPAVRHAGGGVTSASSPFLLLLAPS